MITEIGKIKIKWYIEDRFIRERVLSHYQKFLFKSKKNNVDLKVYNRDFFLPQEISPLITTRSWNYIKIKNKIYFRFPQMGNNSIVRISSDFRKIDFFNSDKHGQPLLYLFPELFYSLILPDFDGLLIHACGIKLNKKIFVFVAPTEGGKSTLAKFALKEGFIVLNDI